MTRDEYLEDEWPKEEPEAAPEEDLCESDDDIWPEEPESTAYRPPDEYRLFQMEDPPEFSGGLSSIQKAEACYQQYCRTKQLRYFLGFLHYYEPTLNYFANDFMLRYAMGGHFADLKQAALFGIIKAKKKYEHDRKTLFYRYADHYIRNELNDYVRQMRRGCTVESLDAYTKLRQTMAIFNSYGGRLDNETLCRIAEEAEISRSKAADMIRAALQNMLCTDIYRSYGVGEDEPEDSREEILVSPFPDPYGALAAECQMEPLRAAWAALDRREQEVVAARLGFCPECFGVLECDIPGAKWYECRPRKRRPYADIALDYSLSDPGSVKRIYENAIIKMQLAYEAKFKDLFPGEPLPKGFGKGEKAKAPGMKRNSLA